MKRIMCLIPLLVMVAACRERDPMESAVQPIPDTAGEAAPLVAPVEQSPEDEALSIAVWRSLVSLLENQTTNDLVVTSRDGEVHLSGRVANVDLKHDITRHVLQQAEVVEVNNQLAVDPSVDISEVRLRDPEEYQRLREAPALPR